MTRRVRQRATPIRYSEGMRCTHCRTTAHAHVYRRGSIRGGLRLDWLCERCKRRLAPEWGHWTALRCVGCGGLVRSASHLVRPGQIVSCADHAADEVAAAAARRRRLRAAAARRRRAERAAAIERTCAVCGEPFRPSRSDALTCSGRCRVAAHRARAQTA